MKSLQDLLREEFDQPNPTDELVTAIRQRPEPTIKLHTFEEYLSEAQYSIVAEVIPDVRGAIELLQELPLSSLDGELGGVVEQLFDVVKRLDAHLASRIGSETP